MSVSSRRYSLSPPQPGASTPARSTHDLKQRVITCLNKLSDRDTLAVAAAELESIARTLSRDSFAAFLNCIHNTDSASKSPVRKQCAHLLTVLSHFHGDALAPFLSKMISTVLRRLRDPDSAVRSACVDAVTAMSSRITKPPFSAFLKPLMETLTQEQDANSQIGAALCLAAAIDSAPDPDVESLRKSILPRLGKLTKNDVCKAKAACLVLIGSVIGVGGASSQGVLNWLVPCLVEFLSSEDWTVRKASAEALERVALVEKDLASQYKALCLDSLQNRRFDKVKVVRETMTRSLAIWKEVTDAAKDDPAPAKSACSSLGADNGKGQCVTKNSANVGFKSSQPKKIGLMNSSPLSTASFVSTVKRESSLKSAGKSISTGISHKLGQEKCSEGKVESPESNPFPLNMNSKGDIKKCDFEVSKLGQNQSCGHSRVEIRRVLFNKMSDEKVRKIGGLRSGSRVVPFDDDDNAYSDVTVNDVNEVCEAPQDVENLSLIREQLIQIENQQSSLLDLLQRFIGSSQSGINSLETRVHGLEMALEEMSYDLAVSSGRITDTDAPEDMCCKLPGTEFLSPKFWRKTEGRYSISPNAVHKATNKDGGVDFFTTNIKRLQHCGGRLIMHSPAGVQSDLKEHLGQYRCKTPMKMIQDVDKIQMNSASKLDGISPDTFLATRNQISRSSV